ncbi:MAG: ATP-binding cassette domain-containing protein [Pseudomonadota bacterium]
MTVSFEATTYDLTVSDLRVEGASGRALLDVPHLSVPHGRSLAIEGASGAGKSTLLFALAGLIPVAKGEINWGDVDIAPLSDTERTAFRGRAMGLVFQDHLLFEELSAAANAGLASLYAPRARRAGIAKHAMDALSGFNVPLDTRRDIDSFSGGERQRIALARALASDPPILLADEPTASLDRARADALIDALFGACCVKKRTLIVASHDPYLLAAADEVVRLEDGRPTPRRSDGTLH